MKLSAVTLLVAANMAAAKSISGKNAAKILRAARRLDEDNNGGDDDGDNGGGDEEEEDGDGISHLTNYDLKFVSCTPGEKFNNADNGNREYGAVVVRLCPSDGGCDSDSTKGCKKGYGDLVVSTATFVQAWFDDQADNMQWDDNFQLDEYTSCNEYEPENQNDDGYEYGNYQFYIGPTCTWDGKDIRLALFEDDACKYESEYSFASVSNGWSLPYSDGGLVSTSCISCLTYENDDDAEYGTRAMCEEVYGYAEYKCESEMEYNSYYGADESGCDYIAEMMPKNSKRGWLIAFWIIFGFVALLLLCFCFAHYFGHDDNRSVGSDDSRKQALVNNNKPRRKRSWFGRVFTRRRSGGRR